MTLKICACLGKCSNSGLFPGTGADERDLAVCAGRRAALRRFLLAGVGFFRAPSISLVVHTSTGRSGGADLARVLFISVCGCVFSPCH